MSSSSESSRVGGRFSSWFNRCSPSRDGGQRSPCDNRCNPSWMHIVSTSDRSDDTFCWPLSLWCVVADELLGFLLVILVMRRCCCSWFSFFRIDCFLVAGRRQKGDSEEESDRLSSSSEFSVVRSTSTVGGSTSITMV